jgi:hypothetical protein
VNGTLKCDNIKRLMIFTRNNINQLSLHNHLPEKIRFVSPLVRFPDFANHPTILLLFTVAITSRELFIVDNDITSFDTVVNSTPIFVDKISEGDFFQHRRLKACRHSACRKTDLLKPVELVSGKLV